jgi:hypothetical protein
VFIVGGFVPRAAEKAVHEGLWSRTVGEFFDRHVLSRKQVPLPVTRVVSRYELAWVQELQGWKP